MLKAFEMCDLGENKFFLGMEIPQFFEVIFFFQKRYALNGTKLFKLDKRKPVATLLDVNKRK